ncbi:MAG TPA: response regulator transcription factor [Gaiellaceae bacterium]|nr:response regulator transcription factor [Gaiellaceae bacterium]
MADKPIEVVIVEDNDVFRESLELLLGLVPDIDVVAAVGDGMSALEVCAAHAPDVVLMDYRLPELDGVETTVAVGQACPEAAVVVLTATAESEEIDALYEAGAVACLTKDRELDEIVGAVRDAAGRGAALR